MQREVAELDRSVSDVTGKVERDVTKSKKKYVKRIVVRLSKKLAGRRTPGRTLYCLFGVKPSS